MITVCWIHKKQVKIHRYYYIIDELKWYNEIKKKLSSRASYSKMFF